MRLSPSWIQSLVHRVVLPASRDVQISRRDAEADEAIPFQDALGGSVVKQRSGLDPMKPQFDERITHDLPHGGGREAPAVALRANPVPEVA
jgi:hypothetical protein